MKFGRSGIPNGNDSPYKYINGLIVSFILPIRHITLICRIPYVTVRKTIIIAFGCRYTFNISLVS